MINIEKIFSLAKEKGITISFICAKLGKQRSFLSDVRQGKLKISESQLVVIADTLGTTTAYLKDETEEKEKSPSKINDEDIKVALFGGEGEVSDEAWEEVKRFAAYAKEKYGKK